MNLNRRLFLREHNAGERLFGQGQLRHRKESGPKPWSQSCKETTAVVALTASGHYPYWHERRPNTSEQHKIQSMLCGCVSKRNNTKDDFGTENIQSRYDDSSHERAIRRREISAEGPLSEI